MRKRKLVKLSALLIVLASPLGGCKVSGTISGSVTCGGGKPCSGTGTVGITVSSQAGGVTPDVLAAGPSSGYSAVIHVPSNELTLSQTGAAQTTLTATTDTGYTTSIVVDMEFTGAAPSTLASGYTAYTFNIPPSDALTNWVNSVNNNTASSAAVVSTTSTAFTPAGQQGSYTVYMQISSDQIGVTSPVSAGFTDPGVGVKDTGCKPPFVCSE